MGDFMFNKLKEIRDIEGLTQKEVADMLHVARGTYSGWESGKDIIPLKRLNDFANLFHVSLDYLVGDSPKIIFVNTNYIIDKKIVAKNLKEVRLNNHLTQYEMAKSINTSQPNVHKYESGKFLITTSYALEFTKKYNYSLDKLVGRK